MGFGPPVTVLGRTGDRGGTDDSVPVLAAAGSHSAPPPPYTHTLWWVGVPPPPYTHTLACLLMLVLLLLVPVLAPLWQ